MPANLQSIEVVLVSPRNPLNIGAAARAMANFGFAHLSVVHPFDPHWREARSAIGAPQLLQNAKQFPTLSQALAHSTLVVATGTLTRRRPEQKVVQLPHLAPLVHQELDRGGRIALVFGPEKHGLTRDDLSWCHLLVEIPTHPHQPSMNLGQAVAVCLYELAARAFPAAPAAADRGAGGLTPLTEPERAALTEPKCAAFTEPKGTGFSPSIDPAETSRALAPEANFPPLPASSRAPSAHLELLAALIEEAMRLARYSPTAMQQANRHDLRLLLRRLAPSARDTRRMLGFFRRLLRRLADSPKQN